MFKKATIVFCILITKCFAQQKITLPEVASHLRFTENAGQWDAQILFRAQLDGGALFMEEKSILFNFYDKKKYRSLHHGGMNKGIFTNDLINCHSYRVRFLNCNTASLYKQESGSDYENYFLGNDENKWKSGVKNYRRVWYKNLYDNIDYEVVSATNGLKYNFYVGPNANPANIQLKYEGVEAMHLKNGVLQYSLTVNSVIEQKPYAYQLINGSVKEVACNYVLKKNVLSFEFPKGYNKNYSLIIDPLLVFAAQSGSAADNFGMTATWDVQGNLYSGGTCFNIGYPTTVGAYSISFTGTSAAGLTDVVISKYNSTGNTLLFSTYFGGTNTEIVSSLIVDNQNNLCLFGATGSSDFPITAGSYDSTFNNGLPLSFVYNGTNFVNGTDIYVSKFNSTGTSLIASTFLGGSKNDGVNHVNNQTPLLQNPSLMEYLQDSLQYNYGDQYRGEIQIDGTNNIYIASSTRSSNFPMTANAFDNSLGGQQDAVLIKFNPSLSQLLYSTYLGGNYNDCGNGLFVKDNGEVYITGGTNSANFPTTNGAYSTNYNGGIADGYLTHFNSISGNILQSTFIGTNKYDQSYFVQADNNSSIYLFGQSLGNMPVINASYFNNSSHQFIAAFDTNLSTLNLSTVIGSNSSSVDISPSAFSIDKCQNIYLSGWGGDIINSSASTLSNMPIMNPIQASTDGNDFYLMTLSPNAGGLLFGSYFGGATADEHVDGGTSRIDKNGIFYQSLCAGCGGLDDFPVTPGAWPNTPGNPNHSQNCNNGVFKLNTQIPIAVATIGTYYSGCFPLTVNLFNISPFQAATNMWHLGQGASTVTGNTATTTFSNQGTYTVSLVVNAFNSCNVKDSAALVIIVAPVYPTVTVSGLNNFICVGDSSILTASGADNYTWTNGPISNSLIVSPFTTTDYTVTASNAMGCSTTTVFTQVVDICTRLSEFYSDEGRYSVYPNPGNGHFYLAHKGSVNYLEIYTVSGQLIHAEQVNTQDYSIDLSDKENGLYFAKLYQDNTLLGVKKLVLQK